MNLARDMHKSQRTQTGSEGINRVLMNPESVTGGSTVALLRLDYLSCFLTVLATVLVGRKLWPGLIVSIVNSSIVCVIGFHTSQFGFIPANVFCIGIYAISIRSWLRKQPEKLRQEALQTASGSVADDPAMSASTQPRTRRSNLSHRKCANGSSTNSLSTVFARVRSRQNAYSN
jgi:hypothetical protein